MFCCLKKILQLSQSWCSIWFIAQDFALTQQGNEEDKNFCLFKCKLSFSWTHTQLGSFEGKHWTHLHLGFINDCKNLEWHHLFPSWWLIIYISLCFLSQCGGYCVSLLKQKLHFPELSSLFVPESQFTWDLQGRMKPQPWVVAGRTASLLPHLKCGNNSQVCNPSSIFRVSVSSSQSWFWCFAASWHVH
jgi:hypothetical protein